MDHVAIMKPSLGLLPKIVSGEKTIESRFYNSKRPPWEKITPGDMVFFKNSGEPVTVSATASQILFNPLDIDQYTERICLDVLPKKRYSILIFLSNVNQVQPFEIDKAGFGSMSAWLTMDNIAKIKRHA